VHGAARAVGRRGRGRARRRLLTRAQGESMMNVQSPRTDDAGIEAEIVAKGLTAPRVTPADIEAAIASEHYFTAMDGVAGAAGPNDAIGVDTARALGLLTFCVLVLRNGFTVTGESACASPENFDAD